MKTLKKFLIYAICVISFWILSDILIYLAINGMYHKIEAKVFTNVPEISITQCVATNVNGVVRGSITNNTNETMNHAYVKIDMYSPRNVKMGTKYVVINNLPSGYIQDFEMWYRYSNVAYVTVSIAENVSNTTDDDFCSQSSMNDLVVSGLVLLFFLK